MAPGFATSESARLTQIRSLLVTAKQDGPVEQQSAAILWTGESASHYFSGILDVDSVENFSMLFDILSTLCMLDVKEVRKMILTKIGSETLLERCTRVYHCSSKHYALVIHIGEFFRQLMDPIFGSDTFIGNAYQSGFLERLCSPLMKEHECPFLQQCVMDLLCFFIVSHHYIAKAYFLRFGSLFKALRTILLREANPSSKIVILGAIRLTRSFLWQKDQQYLRCLSAFNIPSLIVQLVHTHRPNGFLDGTMIYSAALEVLTFICVNNQTSVIESLCRPGSESEELIRILAEDTHSKSHSELASFMLTTMDRLTSQYVFSGGEDLTSRHSIGSSRGRSVSPRPLVVPMPLRKRTFDEADSDGDNPFSVTEESPDDIIPKTPGGTPGNSPELGSDLKRSRNSEHD